MLISPSSSENLAYFSPAPLGAQVQQDSAKVQNQGNAHNQNPVFETQVETGTTSHTNTQQPPATQTPAPVQPSTTLKKIAVKKETKRAKLYERISAILTDPDEMAKVKAITRIDVAAKIKALNPKTAENEKGVDLDQLASYLAGFGDTAQNKPGIVSIGISGTTEAIRKNKAKDAENAVKELSSAISTLLPELNFSLITEVKSDINSTKLRIKRMQTGDEIEKIIVGNADLQKRLAAPLAAPVNAIDNATGAGAGTGTGRPIQRPVNAAKPTQRDAQAESEEQKMKNTQKVIDLVISLNQGANDILRYHNWSDLIAFKNIGVKIADSLKSLSALSAYIDADNWKVINKTVEWLGSHGFIDMKDKLLKAPDWNYDLSKVSNEIRGFTVEVSKQIVLINMADTLAHDYAYYGLGNSTQVTDIMKLVIGREAEFALRALYGDFGNAEKIVNGITGRGKKTAEPFAFSKDAKTLAGKFREVYGSIMSTADKFALAFSDARSANDQAADELVNAPFQVVAHGLSAETLTGIKDLDANSQQYLNGRNAFNLLTTAAGLNMINSGLPLGRINWRTSSPIASEMAPIEAENADPVARRQRQLQDAQLSQQSSEYKISKVQALTDSFEAVKDIIARDPATFKDYDDFQTQFNTEMGKLNDAASDIEVAFGPDNPVVQSMWKGLGVLSIPSDVWDAMKQANGPEETFKFYNASVMVVETAVKTFKNGVYGANPLKDLLLQLQGLPQGLPQEILANQDLWKKVYPDQSLVDIESRNRIANEIINRAEIIFTTSPVYSRYARVRQFLKGVASKDLGTNNLLTGLRNDVFGITPLGIIYIKDPRSFLIRPNFISDNLNVMQIAYRELALRPELAHNQVYPLNSWAAQPGDQIPLWMDENLRRQKRFVSGAWSTNDLMQFMVNPVQKKWGLDYSLALAQIQKEFELAANNEKMPALASGTLAAKIAAGGTERRVSNKGANAIVSKKDQTSSIDAGGLYYEEEGPASKTFHNEAMADITKQRIASDTAIRQLIFRHYMHRRSDANDATKAGKYWHAVDGKTNALLNSSVVGGDLQVRYDRVWNETGSAQPQNLFKLADFKESKQITAQQAKYLGFAERPIVASSDVDPNTNARVVTFQFADNSTATLIANKDGAATVDGKYGHKEIQYNWDTTQFFTGGSTREAGRDTKDLQVYAKLWGNTWVQLELTEDMKWNFFNTMGTVAGTDERVTNKLAAGATDAGPVDLTGGYEQLRTKKGGASGTTFDRTDEGLFIGAGFWNTAAFIAGKTIYDEQAAKAAIDGGVFTASMAYYKLKRNSVRDFEQGLYAHPYYEYAARVGRDTNRKYLPDEEFATGELTAFLSTATTMRIMGLSSLRRQGDKLDLVAPWNPGVGGFAGGMGEYMHEYEDSKSRPFIARLKAFSSFNPDGSPAAYVYTGEGQSGNFTFMGQEQMYRNKLKRDSGVVQYKDDSFYFSVVGNWTRPQTDRFAQSIRTGEFDVSPLTTTFKTYNDVVANQAKLTPAEYESQLKEAMFRMSQAMYGTLQRAGRYSILQDLANGSLSDVTLRVGAAGGAPAMAITLSAGRDSIGQKITMASIVDLSSNAAIVLTADTYSVSKPLSDPHIFSQGGGGAFVKGKLGDTPWKVAFFVKQISALDAQALAKGAVGNEKRLTAEGRVAYGNMEADIVAAKNLFMVQYFYGDEKYQGIVNYTKAGDTESYRGQGAVYSGPMRYAIEAGYSKMMQDVSMTTLGGSVGRVGTVFGVPGYYGGIFKTSRVKSSQGSALDWYAGVDFSITF